MSGDPPPPTRMVDSRNGSRRVHYHVHMKTRTTFNVWPANAQHLIGDISASLEGADRMSYLIAWHLHIIHPAAQTHAP